MRRLYKVTFEAFSDGEWQHNWCSRNVAITGAAEAAIHEAIKREGKTPFRIRAAEVQLIGEEG